MLGEMPELVLLDSSVDPGWNLRTLTSNCQEHSNEELCRVGSLH